MHFPTTAREIFKEQYGFARNLEHYNRVAVIADRSIYIMHGCPVDRAPQDLGNPGHVALMLNTAGHYRRAGHGHVARAYVEHLRACRAIARTMATYRA